MENYVPVLLFMLVALSFPLVTLALAKLASKRKRLPTALKRRLSDAADELRAALAEK